METIVHCILILVLSIFSMKGAMGSINTNRLMNPRTMTFVETQCRRTRYQELCVRTLSNYVNATSQDPQEIAQVALKVSLAKAINTKYYIMKVCKEFNQINKGNNKNNNQAAKDCLDQISDGVSQLTNSVKELQHLRLDGERAFEWHQSNVQSWLSTVLTDAYTCMEGMSNLGHASMGSKVKEMIKAKVLNVAQVTSNALGLFNGFAARHKASHHARYGKNKP